MFDEGTKIALQHFQTFVGLEPTGALDQPTIARMAQPRCGNPDLRSNGLRAAGSSAWPQAHLTYGFLNFSPDLTPEETRAAVRAAFDLWSQVTVLTFSERSPATDADIVIRFASGDHGDGHPFDGPSLILAHAFYPPPRGGDLSGDAHFDDSETWATALPIPTDRVDLVSVAAHEFGHSLGLEHSSDPSALMYPYYRDAHRSLASDDIASIRSLYEWQWYQRNS